MRKRGVRNFLLAAVALSALLSMAAPARAFPFNHTASGQGTDGLGNRLTIQAAETSGGISTGVAFVRLANQGGPQEMVILTCLIWDERPGPGFAFLYSNGFTLDGRQFFIGVFDDNGPGRFGPYDVIYTRTFPVPGPCNVAAVDDYPDGWDPVSSGDFRVN